MSPLPWSCPRPPALRSLSISPCPTTSSAVTCSVTVRAISAREGQHPDRLELRGLASGGARALLPRARDFAREDVAHPTRQFIGLVRKGASLAAVNAASTKTLTTSKRPFWSDSLSLQPSFSTSASQTACNRLQVTTIPYSTKIYRKGLEMSPKSLQAQTIFKKRPHF